MDTSRLVSNSRALLARNLARLGQAARFGAFAFIGKRFFIFPFGLSFAKSILPVRNLKSRRNGVFFQSGFDADLIDQKSLVGKMHRCRIVDETDKCRWSLGDLGTVVKILVCDRCVRGAHCAARRLK